MVLTSATNLVCVLESITSSVSWLLCPLANRSSKNVQFPSFVILNSDRAICPTPTMGTWYIESSLLVQVSKCNCNTYRAD